MKTIHDPHVRKQLIKRIEQIDGNRKAVWGKMTVFQMLRHNTYWNGWILGTEDHHYKQTFPGKIFGKIALRKMIRDEKPFDRNIPTSEEFKVREPHGDLEAEKSKWISLIGHYENYHNPGFVHGFFGKMTKEQIGVLVYKHSDHHLRQFGV